MGNLRRKYNEENTERSLDFGIVEPCVIRSVDTSVRKKPDGSFVNMLMFIKIAQLDESGKLFAETEFGINKVNDDNPSWMSYEETVMRTVNQLAEILEQMYSQEDVDEYFDPFLAVGIEDQEQIEKLLKGNPKNVAAFNEAIKEQFKAMTEDIEGLDSEHKFRFKVIYDSKGRYLQLPQRDFCESCITVSPEESNLSITDYDRSRQAEHAKQLTASKDAPKASPPVPGAKKPAVPGGGVVPGKVPGGVPGVKKTTNPVADKADKATEPELLEEDVSENGTSLGKVPGIKKPPFKKKVVKK